MADETAAEYAERMRKHFGDKADKNKRRTNVLLWSIILGTLAVPSFVALGPGLLLGKVVPSVLSLIAAAATTWMQVRKPSDRWGLYRGAERAIEYEQAKHAHAIDEYDVPQDKRDKLLVRQVARLAKGTHDKWEQLVPDLEQTERALLVRQAQGELSERSAIDAPPRADPLTATPP